MYGFLRIGNHCKICSLYNKTLCLTTREKHFVKPYGCFKFLLNIVKPENVELAISAMNNKSCLGDVVNFTYSAHANPAVSLYQLFENDTALLNTIAEGMWNRRFTSGGVYFYKCVANNTLGSINSTSVMLMVNGNFFELCRSKFSLLPFASENVLAKYIFGELVTDPISNEGTIVMK